MKIAKLKGLWDVPAAWVGGGITLGAADLIISIAVGVSVLVFTVFRTYYLIRDNQSDTEE